MSDLRELYQDVIIDHGRHPRNIGEMQDATHRQEGFNPLCGDKVKVYIKLHADRVENIQFEGCGCAISMASASLMTEALKEKTLAEVDILFSAYHELVTCGATSDHLGKLRVMAGLREFPLRVKCATLAWHTMKAALAESKQIVSTEESV